MKAIIHRKKYDTDTAEKICGFSVDDGDIGYTSETLYRKKAGEFFLYGEGGPLSVYGKPDEDGSMCSASEIFPFSENEAKEFVEEYGSAKIYEELFGKAED